MSARSFHVITLKSFGFAVSSGMKGLVLSVLLVVIFWSFIFLSSADASPTNEVKFRGIVAADERWDMWLRHGSYWCLVTVDVVQYDPSGILSPGAKVTVAYAYSLDLEVGEYVDCYGVKSFGSKSESADASWFIWCVGGAYYVRRTSFFSMLSLIFTLSFVATPLTALYLYRRRQYKAGLKQETQKS